MVADLLQTVPLLGLKWFGFRAIHSLKLITGWFQWKIPYKTWEKKPVHAYVNQKIFLPRSQGPDYETTAKDNADKILQGIPAGMIPVVSAEGHLRVNYKLAKDLGLAIPESWLELAMEINR